MILQMKKLKSRKKNHITVSATIYPLTRLKNKTYQIINHINLSGSNPLKGPNFISLTDVYKSKKGITVAGLKEGVRPNSHEKKVLLKAGAKAYCYNLIPAVILAASRRLKVNAIGICKSSNT